MNLLLILGEQISMYVFQDEKVKDSPTLFCKAQQVLLLLLFLQELIPPIDHTLFHNAACWA